MGWNICGVIVNTLPHFKEIESFDKKKLRTKFKRTKLTNLSPKDLSISFTQDSTLIFLDMLFYQNISERKELTVLESDLCDIFPNSRILIFVINETVDFIGYSLIESGVKLRTKAVATDEIFLDFGELHSKELEVYNEFYESMKKYPDTLQFFENEYSTLNQCERKKFFLRTRDRMYAKKNLENKHNYKNGTLDSTMIEIEVAKMLKADYYDIENIEFVEFERRKLNFKKDSLREFLYVAAKELK